MRLEQHFDVPAPPARAWDLLNDVPAVLPCMPGTELTEIVDEHTFKAKVHLKLGPIALQFAADVVREEMDEAARRVVLAAHARELKGRGRAQATIESTLTELDGATRVGIVTELTLQGAVAQYGRGLVGEVASQLTEQFAACLASKLADGGPPTAPDGAPEVTTSDWPTATQGVSREAAPVRPVGGLRLLWRAIWARLRRGGRAAAG